MSPLAVENGSLVTSGGSLCETCCGTPPAPCSGDCHWVAAPNPSSPTGYVWGWRPESDCSPYADGQANPCGCDAPSGNPNAGDSTVTPCYDHGLLGACCFFDDFTQAYACTENVTALWCGSRTDGRFFEGQTCGDITCPPVAGWYVDCFRNCSDETPGLCDNCSAGPFPTYSEANDYVIANQPPPYCCDYTIVEVTRRENPLP